MIGREELDIIRPAVERAQALQVAAEGPFPSDTLFLKVRDGEFDCAVSMYHDQGQIAIKLLASTRAYRCSAGFRCRSPRRRTAPPSILSAGTWPTRNRHGWRSG